MFKPNVTRSADLPYKVDHTSVEAAKFLSERLLHTVHQPSRERQVVIVCIGTDRSTGDALGPLVGSKLSGRLQAQQAVVYGTLDAPVHAVNLKDTIQEIEAKYHQPYVIAVDACLGQLSSVGMVTLGDGPLKPGAGVNKVLPEVGHIHITGIVNVGGFMEYFVLQNTRLSVVMKMADCIADALTESLTQAATFPLPELPSLPEPVPQKQHLVNRINNLLGFKS
ncbi:putative sporulation protein YyaC [Tumebacillus sp. BK434]|uniref:spore protease YyaC n=1 Tax=Tumebacillus sp. BK434 TaxID=2512169 RepID=UPI00105239BC|nr:spore protease YyaC [Tumebacillus sp. BK434]TCP52219.1 putative sporulation protein YyaC [Tumebacillus sp. BK434]